MLAGSVSVCVILGSCTYQNSAIYSSIMSKALDGQGATPERKNQSRITTGIREITKGGIPITYGHMDTQHCALDILLEKDYISKNQYDAGYTMRALYYTFKQSGRSLLGDPLSPGYEGDFETPQDRAYERYRKAIMVVSPRNRSLIQNICTESSTVPTYYSILEIIASELQALADFFDPNQKR